jgi:hypothetical protein
MSGSVRVIAPTGAQEAGPWREPWERPIHGGDSPGGAEEKTLLPPLAGLIRDARGFPRLTPWANFWRPYRGFTPAEAALG